MHQECRHESPHPRHHHRPGRRSRALLLAACSSDPFAQPGDATVLPSGVAYKVLQPGKGDDHPALSDNVTVNYTLWQPAHTDTPVTSVPGAKPVLVPAKQLESTWDAKGCARP